MLRIRTLPFLSTNAKRCPVGQKLKETIPFTSANNLWEFLALLQQNILKLPFSVRVASMSLPRSFGMNDTTFIDSVSSLLRLVSFKVFHSSNVSFWEKTSRGHQPGLKLFKLFVPDSYSSLFSSSSSVRTVSFVTPNQAVEGVLS